MATLEAVALELSNLNGLADLELDTQLEIQQATADMAKGLAETNQHLVDIRKVLDRFVNNVPEQIVTGFAGVMQQERIIEERTEAVEEKNASRDPLAPVSGGDDKTGNFFKDNFKAGQKKVETPGGFFNNFFGKITKWISGILITLGSWSAIFMNGLSMIGSAITGLVAVITSPITAIAALITSAALGIEKMVADFMNFDGDLVDKLIAGFFGFIDGALSLITMPLDWIKDMVSAIAGFLGFDGVSEALDSFSFTDIVDSLTDSIAAFFMNIKDWIVEKIMGLAGPILSILGFDEAALTAEVNADAYANKDNAELMKEASEKSASGENMFGIRGLFTDEDEEENAEQRSANVADAQDAIEQVAAIRDDSKKMTDEARTAHTEQLAESTKVAQQVAAQSGTTRKVNSVAVASGNSPSVVGAAPVQMGTQNQTTYTNKDLTYVSTNNVRVKEPRAASQKMTTREILEERANDRVNRMTTKVQTDASRRITTKLNEHSPIAINHGDVSSVLGSVVNSVSSSESTNGGVGGFFKNVFGGNQSSASQSEEMRVRTDVLNDSRSSSSSTSGGKGGSVVAVDNSTVNNSTITNMTASKQAPSRDFSDRTHIGQAFGRGKR